MEEYNFTGDLDTAESENECAKSAARAIGRAGRFFTASTTVCGLQEANRFRGRGLRSLSARVLSILFGNSLRLFNDRRVSFSSAMLSTTHKSDHCSDILGILL